MSEFYYLTDGSAVGNYNGMPYNFHPKATPEQWSWFQAELAAGNFQEVARPPDPAADPIDPAIVENSWRETQMPIAQQNVTAIEYGEEDITGTAQQWQKYWLALRKWTEINPDFPDSSKRPVAPS